MCLNGLFSFLSASRRLKAPMMLLSRNGFGSAMLLSTCVSAAKLTTTSTSLIALCTSLGSEMSPFIKR